MNCDLLSITKKKYQFKKIQLESSHCGKIWLRVRHCYCSGSDPVPDLGTCTCHEHGPKKKIQLVFYSLLKCLLKSSLVAQQVKDPAVSLLWNGFSPWPWNFCMLWVQPKKNIYIYIYILKTYCVPNLGIYDEKDIYCLHLSS